MAELADALDLGSSAAKGVQVQVLFPAPVLRFNNLQPVAADAAKSASDFHNVLTKASAAILGILR